MRNTYSNYIIMITLALVKFQGIKLNFEVTSHRSIIGFTLIGSAVHPVRFNDGETEDHI